MWYIHTVEFYSAMRWGNAICSKMDEHRNCHTEWSKSERGYISYDTAYMCSKKWYKWAYLQTEIELQM